MRVHKEKREQWGNFFLDDDRYFLHILFLSPMQQSTKRKIRLSTKFLIRGDFKTHHQPSFLTKLKPHFHYIENTQQIPDALDSRIRCVINLAGARPAIYVLKAKTTL